MPSLQQTTTQPLFVVAIYIIATNFICCYRTCLPPTKIHCIFHLLPPTMIHCIFHLLPPTMFRCIFHLLQPTMFGCAFHLLPPTMIRCIFHLLPPTMIRSITFYCHQQMNVAIVTLATKFVTLQDFFDAMEYTAWQYGHIPT